jgi:hypothetical protein
VRSVKICGAFGTSMDASFTYNFSMPNPGYAFSAAGAVSSAAAFLSFAISNPNLY